MGMNLKAEAFALVHRMAVDYGATFELQAGEPVRWTYEAEPGFLPAARKHLKTVDLQRPGFNDAVVAAIRLLHAEADA